MEETASVFFSKTTKINQTSPTSTFSYIHSDDVHSVDGLGDFKSRGPFLEGPDNFSGSKSCFMFAVLDSRSKFKNVENDTMKLSLNEAKLTGF